MSFQRGPQERQAQVAPSPPFQPAFGTLVEIYLESCGIWEIIRASPINNNQLPYLNAKIERFLFFGGVPTQAIREAGIPFPEDLMKKYEQESAEAIKKDINTAKDKTEADERVAAWRDKFLFQALTEILRALKEFLSENNLLHDDIVVVKKKYGYTYFG